jgi:hypothetical protein
MTEKVVFLSISRVIDPKTGIHYLDAIDEYGIHWMSQMDHKTEPHLCYTKVWYKDPQQPLDL